MSGDYSIVPQQVSEPESSDFLTDVIVGLSSNPRTLPCKYFYDERGATLFQRICELPEYYITRTEIDILDRNRAEIASQLGPNVELIGLGTGAGTKTRNLIEALEEPAVYIPVDISEKQLRRIDCSFPENFSRSRNSPGLCRLPATRRATISSSQRRAQCRLLSRDPRLAILTPLKPSSFCIALPIFAARDGGLLIGVDLQKDRQVLEAAYNDRAGVTAQFNLNLLERVNRELGADFDLDQWRHHAIYNSNAGRIEMHLISEIDQFVHLDEHKFHFRRADKIITEFSYKYTPEEFATLAGKAGLKFGRMWTDDAHLFGLFYFTALPESSGD